MRDFLKRSHVIPVTISILFFLCALAYSDGNGPTTPTVEQPPKPAMQPKLSGDGYLVLDAVKDGLATVQNSFADVEIEACAVLTDIDRAATALDRSSVGIRVREQKNGKAYSFEVLPYWKGENPRMTIRITSEEWIEIASASLDKPVQKGAKLYLTIQANKSKLHFKLGATSGGEEFGSLIAQDDSLIAGSIRLAQENLKGVKFDYIRVKDLASGKSFIDDNFDGNKINTNIWRSAQ